MFEKTFSVSTSLYTLHRIPNRYFHLTAKQQVRLHRHVNGTV